MNVTLAVAAGSFVFETVQRPFDPVVHVEVPPPLQDPVMTAPASAVWVEVWTPIVTFAVQCEPDFFADASRSPTWKDDDGGGGGGAAPTVTLTVAVSVASDGSRAV